MVAGSRLERCDRRACSSSLGAHLPIVAFHHTKERDEREEVFEDRADAGRVLAALLRELDPPDPLVLAIPAGGVPVAVEIARANGWPLDVAVANKITLPWNPEAGYGAIAWDGPVRIDERRAAAAGLDRETIEEGQAKTRAKVRRRVRRLRGEGEGPDVKSKSAILVDDGLASGITMEVAIAALRHARAAKVIVAVPTGHADAVRRMARLADEVVCANVRSRLPYAVADAYVRWQDVPEVVADELLRPFRAHDRPWAS